MYNTCHWLCVELRFRQQIASAKHCKNFQEWDSQNTEKFGFIPLGELILPDIDLPNITEEKIFDVHGRIKASCTHNFVGSQIQIYSQLKPDLGNYWDSQLVSLIRYGFPLDVNYSNPPQSVDKNNTSAITYAGDIQAYLNEEIKFGAILGLFQIPLLIIYMFPPF